MSLPTLLARRRRSDLMTAFCFTKHVNLPIKHLFSLHFDRRIRGHSFKLSKNKFHTRAKQFSITNRVFDISNALPAEVVLCDNVTQFKTKYSLNNDN